MMRPVNLTFAARPSATAYMAGAFLPKPSRPVGVDEPEYLAVWRGFTPAQELSGDLRWEALLGGGAVHPVYLHAASLRLVMALLTHPRFPVPIWRMFQIRNRLVQHRPGRATERLDLEARVQAWRPVPKGLEVDLFVRATSEEEPVLDSTTTFYTRGDFGPPSPAPRLLPPEAPVGVAASWSIPRRGVREFGRLTGDYNPLHWSGRYARALGFEAASAHPHRALAQLVDHLPAVDLRRPLRLEAWFKGPVDYGRPLELATQGGGEQTGFALRLQGDPRAAMVGSVAAAGASSP